MAHWYHPDIVYKTHCDYIRAGARIIITNSFHGAKHILDTIGQGDKSDLINKAAVDIAERARDDAAVTDVWIAGSMSTNPSLEDPLELP